MHRARALVAFLTVVFVVCDVAIPKALAQQPSPRPDDRAIAETLFFTGRGLMEAERYAEACRKFEESYRLDPAAGTQLNLAVCHEKEGRIATAWAEFKEAMQLAREGNRPDREEFAQERVAAIEPQLPRISVEVPADARVAGFVVTRDGVPLGQGAWDTPLPVDPGETEIGAKAPGHKPWSTKVKIAKAEHLTIKVPALEIDDTPPPSPAPTASLAPPPHPVTRWSTSKRVGAVTAIAGVVALGAGAYLGVRTLSARSESDDLCPVVYGERRCSSEGASRMSDAQTLAWATNAAIGVGVLALAAGTYLFVTGKTETVLGSLTHLNVGVTDRGATGFLTTTW